MIRVVNKREHTPSPHDVYIGRPSVLGNIYSHRTGTLASIIVKNRAEAVARYAKWLDANYESDDKVRREIDRLVQMYKDGKHINLVCWCTPFQCHGDVIKRKVEKLAGEK